RLLLPCGWCLLFFSLAGCKRAFYVLPAMPPLALALGAYLDGIVPEYNITIAAWSPLFRSRSVLALALTLVTWGMGVGAGLAGCAAGLGTAAGLLTVVGGTGLAVGLTWGWRCGW